MTSAAALKGIDDARWFAQAIVDTIREPLLVLDKNLRIIVASRSFCRDFNADPQATQGQKLHELGAGEWNIPALIDLLAGETPGDTVIEAYEVERDFPVIGRRVMLLNARKVFYESHGTDAILLAVQDITERRIAERERDALLCEKDMLLQEVQHRVANSLQIIASILMMKAMSVSSEETRAHLHDAHRRVIAVAAVQRHLHVATGAEAILLAPYFKDLCASLAAAMIPEGDGATRLEVRVAGGRSSSGTAVSLGLIVTELVINALKHAFPKGARGNSIVVAYSQDQADWVLTVSDNGVGKDAAGGGQAGPGLGASIVNALAEQLGAAVTTNSSGAGTRVSVAFARAALDA